MLTLSALRWGKPYKSLEAQEVVHFDTGEPIAKIGNVNGGMLQLDMKHAPRARAVLREIPPSELLQRCKKQPNSLRLVSFPSVMASNR